MKHVPRLRSEPDKLAAYRAAHPTDAAADGATSTTAWNRFRDDEAYADVRDRLLERQRGLCGYCEQRLTSASGGLIKTDQQIEHVLPKSGGAGRTLDWTNFMLCCAGGTDPNHADASRKYTGKESLSCGQRKLDEVLDRGCDPRNFPLSPQVVRVAINGRLSADIATCFTAGINPMALDHTINEVLNLNCERLRFRREELIHQLLEWLVPILQEVQHAAEHLTAAQTSTFLDLFVAGRLQPDQQGHLRAFWTTERQYLEPRSPDWIQQNQDLFL